MPGREGGGGGLEGLRTSERREGEGAAEPRVWEYKMTIHFAASGRHECSRQHHHHQKISQKWKSKLTVPERQGRESDHCVSVGQERLSNSHETVNYQWNLDFNI